MKMRLESKKKAPAVLLVEDEKEIMEFIKSQIEHSGYRVISSNTEHDALSKLAMEKFAVIVLDMRLAKGTGEKVIKLTRGNKKSINNETPIVVMSGHLNSDLVISIREQVEAVFVKPFDLNKLLSTIKSLIK